MSSSKQMNKLYRREFLRISGGAVLLAGGAMSVGCGAGSTSDVGGASDAGGQVGTAPATSGGGGVTTPVTSGGGTSLPTVTKPVTGTSRLIVWRDYQGAGQVWTDESQDAGLVLYPDLLYREIEYKDEQGNVFFSWGVVDGGYGHVMTKQIHTVPNGNASRGAAITFRDNGLVREVVPDQGEYWWSFDWTSPSEARVRIVEGSTVVGAFRFVGDGTTYQVFPASSTRSAVDKPTLIRPVFTDDQSESRTRQADVCDSSHVDDVKSGFGDFKARASQIKSQLSQAAPFFKDMAIGGGLGAVAALVGTTAAAPMVAAGASLGFGYAMLTEKVPSLVDITTDPCTVKTKHLDNSSGGGGSGNGGGGAGEATY